MMLSRFDRDTPASKCFYFPIAALIVQGYKRSMIGNQEVNYGEGYCMVVGVDMPGVYQISSVTPEKPFLSISIRLDRRIISQLITEMPSLISSDTAEQEPAVVARAGAELLEAFVRLVDLLDDPGRISVFAPMILREIHYHLLSGSQGGCLRFFSRREALPVPDSRSAQQRSGQLHHIGSSCTQHGNHHAGQGVCKDPGRNTPDSPL